VTSIRAMEPRPCSYGSRRAEIAVEERARQAPAFTLCHSRGAQIRSGRERRRWCGALTRHGGREAMVFKVAGDRWRGRVASSAMANRLLMQAFYLVLAAGCSSSMSEKGDGAGPEDSAPHPDARVEDASNDAIDASPIDASMSDETLTDTPPSADGDVGCTCSYFDSGFPPEPFNGDLTLPCYCALPWGAFFGLPPACLTYDESVDCQGEYARRAAVVTYANCNLVTIAFGSFGPDQRHYDAATHDLVGAHRGTDHSIPCGDRLVFSIRSGVQPADDCQVAKIELLCSDSDAGVSDGD
jgi:hypothetical protein